MTLSFALHNGWDLVRLDYDGPFALVERQRNDRLKERALALRLDEAERRPGSGSRLVPGRRISLM